MQLVADLLVPMLPESPPLYPEGDLTDEPEQVMVAELIREAALEGVRDELPHSIAVVVEEMLPREDRPADKPLLDIHANVYIERPSQKGIIIGPKGKRLNAGRRPLVALPGHPVGRPRRGGLAGSPAAGPGRGRAVGGPACARGAGSRTPRHRSAGRRWRCPR
ncbi:GTPase Era OS=Streptomyces paromomycinus OX=92743 GN=era PE=3 SV=1 [Streptomyces rimosus subsp. rimosus]